MLEVSVSRRQGPFELQATFSAPTSGVIALFGRSGSGKTTLINILSGLIEPDTGTVRLDGEVLTDRARRVRVPVEARRIGYVFQDARLFPHLRVEANLRYGQRRAPGPQVIGFEEVVALLGLGPHLQQRPHQLSGGERARVALGRALLSQPRLLLLDEPLASLDLARRAEVLPYLEALRGRLHLPIVYVSHQYEEVLRLGSYLVLLEQGRVLAQGSVSELSLHPGLQALVGPELTGAVLEAQVVRVDGTGSAELAVGGGRLSVTLPGSVAGERVRVQVLARDVILALQPVAGLSVRNALQGTIGSLSEAGDDVLVRVDLGGAAVLARITPAARRALALAPGMPVWVLFKAIATRGHAFRIERAGL